MTVLGEFGGRRETPAARSLSAKACGECRRNYMAHNPEAPGSIPGRANMPRGSSTVEHRRFFNVLSPRAWRSNSGKVTWRSKQGPNAGRDYIQPHAVSPNPLSASVKSFCWRMPAGVHGAFCGFNPRFRAATFGNSRQPLSPAWKTGGEQGNASSRRS